MYSGSSSFDNSELVEHTLQVSKIEWIYQSSPRMRDVVGNKVFNAPYNQPHFSFGETHGFRVWPNFPNIFGTAKAFIPLERLGAPVLPEESDFVLTNKVLFSYHCLSNDTANEILIPPCRRVCTGALTRKSYLLKTRKCKIERKMRRKASKRGQREW